ncbi:MAG: hypothetical protein A2745_02740 [Candidatus Harrisonbacteria bacterium RIFCSPHIGHO2_01_FULL_44_13]|uniref:Septation protein SpoVG n=1 Tax=Candidatus Harrisonbacteria bacterium RIFCSPLOWO2_01_FULL_44_18 TaxID=1798407 RepID=A0A1G1ZMW5_9BACT|nr:MAG: hypothetical protein A2745_02740 [Candidatus Harrisonbacteria bacterium RIFCSPHIGHO2_01_FULL_44_13]OGY65993.1 MAG: hypothetical protein A3A16_01235 [Candidatus Harrisonbacteria bacterium RIFCSPLOWO2_01_FULL_44_18]
MASVVRVLSVLRQDNKACRVKVAVCDETGAEDYVATFVFRNGKMRIRDAHPKDDRGRWFIPPKYFGSLRKTAAAIIYENRAIPKAAR